MSKTIKVVLAVFVLSFIFGATSVKAAYNHAEVLGVSDSTSNIQMPATTEGPGLVLPDSPLFFLDQVKQATRVFFAFNHENKARIYEEIAGERFAELRFMLAKNNRDGVRVALQGVAYNFEKAGAELAQARLSGRDVSKLAKTINDDIRLKQQSLDVLEGQATGDLKSEVVASSDVVLAAKIEMEESLPQADLENEIAYDLNRQIVREVSMTSAQASYIQTALTELNKQVALASQNALKRRQEALNQAIASKNLELQKSEERLLQLEKSKQEQLLSVQQSTMTQVKEVAAKAAEAAVKLQQAQQTTEQIKSQLSLPIQSQSVAGDKSEE